MLMGNLKAYKSGKHVRCHRMKRSHSNCACFKPPTQGIRNGYGN